MSFLARFSFINQPLTPYAALSATYFAHIGFFNPYLPLWLKDLGLSLFAIGLLTSVQAASRIFAPYGWGWMADRWGQRVKLLRYSALMALVFSLGLWLDLVVTELPYLFVVLLVMFVHTSAMMPMNEAAVAQLVSESGRFNAHRYGRVRLWGSTGFLCSVLIAGWWFELKGLDYFPQLSFFTLFLVVVCVWSLPSVREPVTPKADRQSILPVLRQPAVIWFFVALFFHVLSHMGIYIFLSLYLDEAGYSKTLIGVYWAASVLAEIIWFYTQGRWLPRWPLTVWLCVASALAMLRMGLIAWGVGLPLLLLLAQLLHAMTFGAHHSVCVALLSHHFPGSLRGRGQALYTVVGYGLPGAIAGLAGAALSQKLGLNAVYWACSAAALVALLCALRVWRLAHPKASPELPQT
jgi:MFS transporter, PPP family, 3-phenylpropionic acid transporter